MQGPSALRKETTRAVKWSFVSSAGTQAVRFVGSAVLARLLSPSYFGIIAMATLVLGFFRLLGESGTYNVLVAGAEIEGPRASAALIVSSLSALGFVALTLVVA